MDEIENYEKVVGDTEAQCERKVREEQDRDQKIDRMKENKDRLENDLRHLISEVGTGINKFIFEYFFWFICKNFFKM